MAAASPTQPLFYWTLPVAGDGRGGATRDPARPRRSWGAGLHDSRDGKFNYYDYLSQVARAAQAAGFTGAFVPWDEAGEDSWIVTSGLAREIKKLRFLPEVQPGFSTPVYFAKLAASFQRFAGERLAWKVDLERAPQVRRAHGEQLDGADFFARADEFITATRGVWSEHPYNFEGRFFGVEAGGLTSPMGGHVRPPLYTAGTSEAALELAARQADVHLLDPSAEVESQLRALRAASERAGRDVSAGIRLSVIARHTSEEAWAEARLQTATPAFLVGSHEEVAERLDQLVALGVREFVFGGSPHVEEAYRFGEHIFPRLSAAARPARQAA